MARARACDQSTPLKRIIIVARSFSSVLPNRAVNAPPLVMVPADTYRHSMYMGHAPSHTLAPVQRLSEQLPGSHTLPSGQSRDRKSSIDVSRPSPHGSQKPFSRGHDASGSKVACSPQMHANQWQTWRTQTAISSCQQSSAVASSGAPQQQCYRGQPRNHHDQQQPPPSAA